MEGRAPISLLSANLYFKDNLTYSNSFEKIVNDCCDVVDDSFLPLCNSTNKIKFTVEKCNEETETMKIRFLNCKTFEDDNIIKNIKCTYIPFTNIKGILITSYSIFSVFSEIILIVIIIRLVRKC